MQHRFYYAVQSLAILIGIYLSGPAGADDNFTNSDLAGTWYEYSFWDHPSFNDPGWDRGTATVDTFGVVTGGTVIDSDGFSASILGGNVSIDASGIMSGSVDYSDGTSDLVAQYKMDADKNVVVGVDTDSEGYRFIDVAIRGGGSFATSDLEGKWYEYSFWDHPSFNDPGWDRGIVTIDASGTLTGGTVTDSDGFSASILGGSVSIDANGIISGSVDYAGGSSDLIRQYKMDADKNIIVGVDTDNEGYRFINVAVRAGFRGTAVDLTEIDIKPFDDPNSINLKSKGAVPVAICGSNNFDVNDIDLATIRFGLGGAAPAHDLLNPKGHTKHLEDVCGDGNIDLVLHFRQQQTGIGPSDLEACVEASLIDGTLFRGCDTIRPRH